MNKFILIVSIMMLALSCSNDADVVENKKDGYAPVTVKVNDFSLSVESFAPRRAPVSLADYTGVKAITLAFYDSQNTEVYKSTQVRADNTTYTTFGEFSCSLVMGSYTMVVLGYGGENVITLTSKTNASFANDRIRETFVYSQAVNITGTAAVNLSATLNRVVSQLNVYSTDNRPANATQIRMTFSAGGDALNPTTGLSTTNTGFSNTLTFSTSVGATTRSGSFLFLNTDEQTMNVTIDILDASNNVITTKQVSDVPFKRNRCTRLTGSLYSASSSSTFTLETTWLDEVNYDF